MGWPSGQTNTVHAGADTTDLTLAPLASALALAGLDLVAAGPLGAYHAAVPPALRLPRPDDHMIVLVGASRALWPPFLAALARAPERRRDPHPLDRWVAEQLAAIADTVLAGLAPDVLHYWEPPPRRVALQHLAAVLGVAGRAPCGLSLHPTHGLWLSLRAAIVVAAPPPPAPPPRTWPCATCAGTPCVPALERALALGEPLDHAAIRAHADAWIAVRDACPVGRAARYSDGQLRWHYTHDRSALDEPPAPDPA